MSLETGQTLLHYRIVEKIGEGGMGVVWKARDTTLDRDVAIKVLPEAFAGEGERFLKIMRADEGQAGPDRVVVVLNWFDELRRRSSPN